MPRPKRVLTLLVLTCGGALFVACDAVAEYTVDNQTDQRLTTRAVFEEDCDATGGLASDYLPEQVVEPRSQFEYIDIYGAGPDGVSCIQVLDEDRRLILAEKYHGGRIYLVTDELSTSGDPVPESQTLPDHSQFGHWREDLSERPIPTIITLFGIGLVLALWFAFVFVLPVAVLVATVIFIRNLLRRIRAGRAG